MTSTLLLPGGAAPSNLHLRDGVSTRMVTSDMFDICRRIREVDPSLYLLELGEGEEYGYAVMEHARDHVERLVFRVKADELDGRVIDRLRYLMSVPLSQRMDELEAAEFKLTADRKEAELEELYERLGAPMLRELHRCHFIDNRPKSYPKLGVAAPGRAR